MRIVSLLIGLLALFFGDIAEACRTGTNPPAAAIEPGLVAFVGVVEGYAQPKAIREDMLGSGLRVRVTEGAIDAQVGATVDVYPSHHGANCRPLPYSLDMLQGWYRPGAIVSVVAWSEPGSVGFPSVVHTSDLGGQKISIVPAEYPRTANGTLDFAKAAKASRAPTSSDSTEYWRHFIEGKAFQDYEFHKSLALLASGLDEPHKVIELENIRYYYGYADKNDPGEGWAYAKAYVDLVHNARLSEPAQSRVLAEFADEVDASRR